MNKLVIEPELLWSLYWGNGYSTYSIGNIFDCSYGTIWNRMKEYNIPRYGVGNKKGFDIEPELLESLYHGNSYSLYRIANIFGCGDGTILRRMKEYSIPRREVTDFTFNNRQKEIFEGCMLGDGSLTWQRYGNNCYFSNTDIHEEYLLWLQKQLGVEDISSIYHNAYNMTHQLSTRVIPSIHDEYKRWQPNGTGTNENRHYKIIPDDIELTPIKLLFWYIGDGHYSKRDDAVMFSNHLDFDTWEILSKKMYKVLDIDNGISINKCGKDHNGNQIFYLRLNKTATREFFDLIDGLSFSIPDCYLHKFGR